MQDRTHSLNEYNIVDTAIYNTALSTQPYSIQHAAIVYSRQLQFSAYNPVVYSIQYTAHSYSIQINIYSTSKYNTRNTT